MNVPFSKRIRSLLKSLSSAALTAGLAVSLAHTASAITPFPSTGTYYPDTLEEGRIFCSPSNGTGSLSHEECLAVARDFYRDVQYQILNFNNDAFDVIQDTSIEMYADGSGYTKGITEALPAYGGVTGGHVATLSIENAFAYQPIDKDTVVFFGAPLFTSLNPFVNPMTIAHIENVQMSVYRRISGELNDPTCRNANTPYDPNNKPKLCWAIMAELWSYQLPLGSGISATLPSDPAPQPGERTFPRSSVYPSTLEDDRIICDSPSGAATADPAWVSKCKSVAQSFYDEFRLDQSNYTGDGLLEKPASIMTSPDGSGYVTGVDIDNLYSLTVDKKTETTAVQNAFVYKPTDENTVIVLGAPILTVSETGSSESSYVKNTQISVYRRTNQGVEAPSTCRSEAKPNGNNCWVLVNKLWTYQPTLGSGVSVLP